jgi:hypothetical protein
MRHPDTYLAAALAEWPDEDLAWELGCDPERVWRLRLSQPPRVGHWEADVRGLADLAGVEPTRLAAVLRWLGVRPAHPRGHP